MAPVLTLAQHLRDTAAKPFAWGVADCCLGPSDWMLAKRGVDPAAPLRGAYSTARGAMRHVRRRGGFLPMVDALMTSAGFEPTDAPQPGDVGVVDSEQGQALAVKTKLGWAVKGVNGFVVAPFRHLKAWSV